MPHDCCFRPSYACNPSSNLLHSALSWLPRSCRLLCWDGSWFSLSPEMAQLTQSCRVCGSCRFAWCSKNGALRHNGKPTNSSFPFGHAQPREWPLSKNYKDYLISKPKFLSACLKDSPAPLCSVQINTCTYSDLVNAITKVLIPHATLICSKCVCACMSEGRSVCILYSRC